MFDIKLGGEFIDRLLSTRHLVNLYINNSAQRMPVDASKQDISEELS